MNIQFACAGCGNQLSVPPDAAGKKARCPKCTTVVDVPTQTSAGPDSGGDEYQMRPPEDPPASGSASSGYPTSTSAQNSFAPAQKPLPYSDNPYASPSMGYDEPIARKTGAGEIRPTLIDFGDVFSHAWNLYMQNVGMVLGAVMLAYVINLVLGWVIGFMNNLVILAIGENDAAVFVVIPLQIVIYLVQIAISTFFSIGVWRILLDVGKGQSQDFGKLFSGGDIFLPMFGAMILWFLMVIPGTILLIIPGVVILLLFGQFHFLMVDQRMSVMESFSTSLEITRGNWLTLLGIYTVSLLIAIGCFITCIPVGMIFFGPYVSMVWCVMYLKMTGQRVAPA